MRWGTLLLLLLAFQAPAETIYRCPLKGGKVSIQNHPCEAGAPLSVRHVEAPGYSPEAAAQRRRVEAEMQRRNAAARQGYYAPTSQRPTQSQRDAAACQGAKRHRETMLKIVGMRRNFDLLRSLDENVRRACR